MGCHAVYGSVHSGCGVGDLLGVWVVIGPDEERVDFVVRAQGADRSKVIPGGADDLLVKNGIVLNTALELLHCLGKALPRLAPFTEQSCAVVWWGSHDVGQNGSMVQCHFDPMNQKVLHTKAARFGYVSNFFLDNNTIMQSMRNR